MVKTVVIVNDFAFLNGGAGKVALSSAKALPSMGIRTILFSAVAPVDESLRMAGVEVVCLEQYDILSSPSKLRAAVQGVWNKKALREFSSLLDSLDEKTTIIHLHGWSKAISASLWKALSGRNFEVVVTLHDYFLFCPNLGLYNYRKKKICDVSPSSFRCYLCNCDARSYAQKLWRSFRQVVQWSQLRSADKFSLITIGETNRNVSVNSLESYVKKVYFLQNPVDLTDDERVKVEENDVYVFMGRLSYEKGVEMFCEAISSLHLKGCVVGDGYLKEELDKKYPQLPFVGWKSGAEKMDILKKAKCLVFPSLWYEGAPLTIIEMKSMGIPCIVPDRCAASEVVTEGESGFIFPIGDMDGLKQAIMRCENSNLGRMSEQTVNGFDKSLYSLDTHVNSLIGIYNDILSHKS